MSISEPILVTGVDGLHGRVLPDSPNNGLGAGQTLIQLDSGRQVVVPSSMLTQLANGTMYLPMSVADLEKASTNTAQADTTNQDGRLVIPVIAEQVQVERRPVVTGAVRISKVVSQHEQVVDEPILREEVQVERVPINQWTNSPVPIRYEGETMIIPVLEEVLVVEKRLVVKEELHITKRQFTENKPQTVTLRSEDVRVDRVNPATSAPDMQSQPGNDSNFA